MIPKKILNSILEKQKIKDVLAYSVSLFLPKVAGEKRHFRLWEKKGIHILPVRFAQPIPNTSRMEDKLWSKSNKLAGIDINEKRQLELLTLFESKYKKEYDKFPLMKTHTPYEYYVKNGLFGSVDGEILYCMIRQHKPKKIFEIGSGNSTLLSAQAIIRNSEENSNYECELVAIEPSPNEVLRKGFPGLSRLVPKKVQAIPLSEFTKLAENDILFIDSSHVLKVGSDVSYEYLEILPKLNKGVLIHMHDIFLPNEYPRRWFLKEPWFWFWNEQYLLQAFLAFNESFEVLWAGNYMHLKYPDRIAKAFSSYKKDDALPRSFWIRRKK